MPIFNNTPGYLEITLVTEMRQSHPRPSHRQSNTTDGEPDVTTHKNSDGLARKGGGAVKMPFRSSVTHLLLCNSLDLRKHFAKTETEGEGGKRSAVSELGGQRRAHARYQVSWAAV